MPAYLAMSDVAVIPSLWDDPFPTTVLEAQAMGLPVISTRRGGIPEEVSAENAILLDTDKDFVPQLAKAILQLHDNAEKRQEMAAASLRHAQQFSKESFARHFFQSLDKFMI
jgi:glycosyltransferase involved in cell wall biosynthesis